MASGFSATAPRPAMSRSCSRERCPGVPVVVGKDRRESGRLACERFAPDVIVLDDGMQYWQLHRDLDIVVLDARKPFGSGFVMPMGDLREPHIGSAPCGRRCCWLMRALAMLWYNCAHRLHREAVRRTRPCSDARASRSVFRTSKPASSRRSRAGQGGADLLRSAASAGRCRSSTCWTGLGAWT